MTTYTFPDIVPTNTSWRLVTNVAEFVNPFTNSVKTDDRGGEHWRVLLTFNNLTNGDRDELAGFLAQLNGRQHRFTIYDHAKTQRGTLSGTPVVDGASQTGKTLNIAGAGIGVTGWIKRGDWFSFGNELKMATADANSDGIGDVAVSFVPRIRTSPANSDPVTVSDASGVFMLADPTVSWSNIPGDFSSFSFEAIEDVLA